MVVFPDERNRGGQKQHGGVDDRTTLPAYQLWAPPEPLLSPGKRAFCATLGKLFKSTHPGIRVFLERFFRQNF